MGIETSPSKQFEVRNEMKDQLKSKLRDMKKKRKRDQFYGGHRTFVNSTQKIDCHRSCNGGSSTRQAKPLTSFTPPYLWP